MESTSGVTPASRCAARSGSCSSNRFCSGPPSGRTSPMADPRRTWRRSSRRPERRTPTSSSGSWKTAMTGLDAESEANVREALDRLMARKTCLMITHDLRSIADADVVLVLEEGRIIGRGTHAELLAGNPRYRQMYTLDLQQPAASLST